MKAAFKLARSGTGIAIAAVLLFAFFTGSAYAQPIVSGPSDGALIVTNSQLFSWTDNGSNIDHWYLEISTSPVVDSWGFFWNLPVFASTNLTSPSLTVTNLSALPNGTYYWHVLGYYGPGGINGTAWSLPVRSFNLLISHPPGSPAIGVNPLRFNFSAVQGGANPASTNLIVSNIGYGTLYFMYGWNAPWLDVSGSSSTLTVSTNIAGLAPGTYDDTITVGSNPSFPPPASNGPLYIPVRLIVTAPSAPPVPVQPSPKATKLTLSAKPKVVVLGKTTLLKGKLLDATGKGLVGKNVKIKAGKKVIKTVTTRVGGVYKLKVKPKKKTRYKAVFAGDAAYKAATSKTAAVAIKS